MGFGPAYGTGTGGGAVDIFIKKDGNPALFADTSARDTYFTTNPDELERIKASGDAVGIGNANQITAAYIYQQNKWQPIATNFKGDKGATGATGADGKGIDPSKMTDKSIPVWDNTLQTFIDSGVSSPDSGSIKMDPNSLEFGLHTMSSAIEDVTFTNTKTKKNYSPVWQELKPGTKDAVMRIIGSEEDVERVPKGTDDVTNPKNSVTIDADEVFLGGTFELTNDATNVVIEFLDSDTQSLIWHYEMGNLAAGEHDITFDVPFKVFAGYQYDVQLKSDNGPVVAKGSGTEFSWTIQRAQFTEALVASQDWVNDLDTVDDVTANGTGITVTYRDGSTADIPLSGGGTAPGKTVRDVTVQEYDNTITIFYTDNTNVTSTLPDAVTNVAVNGQDLVISFYEEDDIVVPLPSGGSGAGFMNNVDVTTFTSDLTPSDTTFLDQVPYFFFTGSADATLNLIDMANIPTGRDIAIVVANTSIGNTSLSVSAGSGDSIHTAGSRVINLPRGYTGLLISDKANRLWNVIRLDHPGTGGTGPVDKYVADVQADAGGRNIEVTYSDGTSAKVSLDGFSGDIGAISSALQQLQKRLIAKTKFFVYRGSTAPTIPKGTRGGYYLTFFGLSGNIDTTTPPTASAIADGTLFFVDNNDDTYNINITPGKAGDTIDGGSAFQVVPDTSTWFVRNGTDWQVLYTGYLPSSYKHLLGEIKSSLLADDSFIQDIKVQGDDPNRIVDCTSLEFPGCSVSADPNDSKKGIINIPGNGAGLTFVNPDGTEHTANKFKLVGMEIKDPGDGTPLKLILVDNHNTPQPHNTSAYAFFSTSKTAPNTVDFDSLPVFRGGRVTVHKDTADPQYAYILLPPGEGDDAERIGELGGLPAYWAKESKSYTIGGQQRTYTVFRSPYPFTEKDVTLVIYP